MLSIYYLCDINNISIVLYVLFIFAMDYQCIVVYTIVRISPFYPYTTEWPVTKHNNVGCLDWIKSQVKRFDFFLLPMFAI